jgi:hypothetical protein
MKVVRLAVWTAVSLVASTESQRVVSLAASMGQRMAALKAQMMAAMKVGHLVRQSAETMAE